MTRFYHFYGTHGGAHEREVKHVPENKTTLAHNRIDLTGQRFGKLVAVEPAENVGGKTTWLCRCDCGKERIVKTKFLRNGKTRSCGCTEKPRGLQQMHYVDGTCIEMLESQTIRSNNTSGCTGVGFISSENKWRAEIMLQGKRHYLGRFHRKEDAIKAWRDAKERYHDEFVKSFGQSVERPSGENAYEEKISST